MILLTDVERDRFATYLEQGAASDEAMADQVDKIGPPVFAKKLRAEALAAKIVAGKLRATTAESVSG